MVHLRAMKMSRYQFQLTYYICAVSFGLYTMRDGPWLPWFYGGKGNFDDMMKDAPFTKPCPGSTTYMMYQLGYHGSALVELVFIAD